MDLDVFFYYKVLVAGGDYNNFYLQGQRELDSDKIDDKSTYSQAAAEENSNQNFIFEPTQEGFLIILKEDEDQSDGIDQT
mmetsp:Transcript_22222/g.3694  ORF Transcript_22222/g.3694 Transcript_22222/m.3694 type:complete len:80 (+) Transcript_22222:548-787(+)